MPKSRSDRSKNGSEVSSRSDRRRTEDEEPSRTRSRADSATTSSSRRKSSRREDDEHEDGFIPTSTSFSSASRSPYAGVAAPSVASSYATAYNNAPAQYNTPPDLVRNDSMAKKEERRDSKKDSRSGTKAEKSRRKDDSDDDDDADARNVGRAHTERSGRRESRKSSRADKKEKTRSFDEHDAALPQNQFPGEMPSQYTAPYRPPGLASDYYGDQGQSVASQPGVRPNPPSVIQTADQAHLMEPTIEAKPPPEPSSLGQAGAAASFFSMDGNMSETGQEDTPTKPGRKPSWKPSNQSKPDDSPRASPGPNGKLPDSFAGSAMGAAAVGVGMSAASEYYSGRMSASNGGMPSLDGAGFGAPPRADSPESYIDSSRPPRPSQSAPQTPSQHYGAAAAAGLAGAAAGAYFSSHQQSDTHHHSAHSSNGPGPNITVGQNQSAFPQMQQRRRQKRRGPLGKVVDWFKDPSGVAEFEQYTEAIGVCKYCFDPNTSAMDAPRKHRYHRHRPSGSRHGSSTRVDKTYRYSSSDDERRRSSTAKKVVVGGLAGYGAAKIGEALYKQNHDFDDTYSVKSGRPANRNRVSFKEDEDRSAVRKKSKYEAIEDVRLERRDSGRRSRRDEAKYEKRSSRRRGSSSSSSSHSMSRATALGLGASAAGLAMGAVAAHERRKSRSRSRSPSKRKGGYYSKRISPRHSYVDLSATNTGPFGLGAFFSPSSNKKKGKKSKGLFNFGNASSSSSDADLAFGEGTVRRKESKKGRAKMKEDHNYGSTAALMGLAATGAALAVESDRRKSKGKDSRYANDRVGNDSRSTKSRRINLKDHETTTDGENDGAWEDASDDDDNSSIDTALAYGGRLSAAQSRESLNEHGTSNWDWRWKKNRDRRKSRADSGPAPVNTIDSTAAGMMATGIGAAAAASMMSEASASAHRPGSLPPMQHVDSVPTSDPAFFEARRTSAMSGVSPGSGVLPSQNFAGSDSIPLHQPRPVAPIGTIPGTFGPLEEDLGTADQPQPQQVIADDSRRSARDLDRESRPRRGSSPAKLPSRESRSSVTFAIPDEDLEKEQRQQSRRQDNERRRSADAAALPGAAGKLDEDAEAKAEADRRAAREAEIEAELERLYEEDRRRTEDRKRKDERRKRKVEVAGIAAAAAAVGAGMAASVIAEQEKGSESSERDSKLTRKSSLKKNKGRSDSPAAETQQERIARMAAHRVRSTPSAIHDDYGKFFTPAEIAEHVAEHNEESAHRDDPDPQVVEIVPGKRKNKPNWFDEFTYRPFGINPEDDPTAFPWPVPALGRIEPTPPGSRAHTPRGPSPIPEPPKEETEEEFNEQLERRSSRVTWGDHDTYVYEVMTPEYERSDFIADSPQKVESPAQEVPSSVPDAELVKPEASFKSKLSSAWTIDDDDETVVEERVPTMEKMIAEPREHVGTGKDFTDLPKSNDQPRRGDFTAGEDEPTPAVQADLDDLLDGRQFYQSPFVETVSDLGDMGPCGPDVPKTERSFVEDAELPETPKEEFPLSSGADARTEEANAAVEAPPGPRLSKSERRRMERAASSSEAVSPAVEPEPVVEDAEAPEAPQPAAQAPGSVFDYLVDEDGRSLPPASALGVAASSVLSNGQSSTREAPAASGPGASDGAEVEQLSKPKRASTFDDATFEKQHSRFKSDYASDPEDWERTAGSKKKRDKKSSKSDIGVGTKAAVVGAVAAGVAAAATADDEFYSNEKRKRKSKRASDIFDDDDVQSVASSPATTRDAGKSSRRKSKRDSEPFDDDDNKSVASSPADGKKSRIKDKDKDKRASGGLWGTIFGTKSDVSTSSKKSSKSSKSEGRAERERSEDGEKRKKRRSKSRDFDDAASAVSEPARRSRRDSTPLAEQRKPVMDSRDQSVDDGFVSAEESAPSKGYGSEHEHESFLAERPDMPQQTAMDIPMATDGVSGLITERPTVQANYFAGTHRDMPGVEAHDAVETVVPLDSTPEARRISALKTDVPTSPAVASSPTAVPIHFRRLPISPGTPRVSLSSPGAPPSSPVTTPRTRQNRPRSTEFRSSKEFRPLYLVEKSNSAKTPVLEEEEDLPSLPSSRTSSAHPSMENLRGEAKAAEAEDYFDPERVTPQQLRERGRRHSHSYWQNEPRRESPDYLDSRSATPVPTDVQKLRDSQPKKERPKYEFHSPSELLQDPAMVAELAEMEREAERPASPLPSVVSTEHDQDFMSARGGSPALSRTGSFHDGEDRSRARSRSRSRSKSRGRRDTILGAGLGITAGSVLGLATDKILSRSQEPPSTDREEPDMDDMYGAGPPLSTPIPPPATEGSIEIEQVLKEQTRDRAEDNVQEERRTDGAASASVAETAVEKEMDWAPSKKSKKEKRKSKGKKDIVEPASEPGPTAELEPIVVTPVAEEDEGVALSSKKSKKDKKKKDKRKDTLPPLDIGKAETKDEFGERVVKPEDDEPLTAVPSEMSTSRELPPPGHVHEHAMEEVLAQAAAEDLAPRKVSVDEQVADVGDLAQPEYSTASGAKPPIGTKELELDREPVLDLPTDFSEHGSRVSFPWDAAEPMSTPLPEDEDREPDLIPEEQPTEPEVQALEHIPSFVPSSALLNQKKNDLGAFEEAFERAVRARGLTQGFSREEALDGLLPRRNNAPFIAKGALTPIGERSLATTPEDKSQPVEDQAAEEVVDSQKTKKEKREREEAELKGSTLRDSVVEDGAPEAAEASRDQAFHDTPVTGELMSTSEYVKDAAKAPADLVDGAAPDSVTDVVQDRNPFGDDFEVREDEVAAQVPIPNIDPAANIVQEPESVDRESESVIEPKPNEAAENLSWAPTSRKNKKKKKSQSSTPAEISTPVEETPTETPQQIAEEVPIEAPQQAVESVREDFDDSWAASTSKKGKKGKKDKKKQSLGWNEDVAAPTVAIGAVGAAAAAAALQGDEKQREVVAEPEQIPDAHSEASKEVVAESETITTVAAIQVESSRDAPVDDFAAFTPTGKKGKKSKKSKPTAFDWDAPQDERAASEDNPSIEQVVDEQKASMPGSPGVASRDEPSMSQDQRAIPTESTQEPPDHEWAPAPAKLSKKDKKKAKKGKGVNILDLDEPAREKIIETDALASMEVTRDSPSSIPELANKDSPAQAPVTTDLDSVQSASAQDRHDAYPHQDFLADAQSKPTDFPPESEPEAPREVPGPGSEQIQEEISAHPLTVDLDSIQNDAQAKSSDSPTRPSEAQELVEPEDAQIPDPETKIEDVLPDDVTAATEGLTKSAQDPAPGDLKDAEDAQEDDIVFTPAKKTKDKKKGKRKSTTQDVFEELDVEKGEEPPVSQHSKDDVLVSDPRDIEHTSIASAEERGRDAVPEKPGAAHETSVEIIETKDIRYDEPKPAETVPPEETPIEAPSQQVDDFSLATDKKSKKGKKKSERRSATRDYVDEQQPSNSGEVSPAAQDVISKAEDVLPKLSSRNVPTSLDVEQHIDADAQVDDSTAKQVSDRGSALDAADAVKEQVDVDVAKERDEVLPPAPTEPEADKQGELPEPISTDMPPETPAEELEGFSWASGKKSKKDKNKSKKKGSLAFDDSETASPATEPAEPQSLASSDRDIASDLAATTVTGATVALALDQPETTRTKIPGQEPDDFAWQPSTKKSKKDKKKRKSLAWADEEPSTPASQDENVALAEEQAGDIVGGQPATVDEVERHARFAEGVVAEPKDLSEELDEPATDLVTGGVVAEIEKVAEEVPAIPDAGPSPDAESAIIPVVDVKDIVMAIDARDGEEKNNDTTDAPAEAHPAQPGMQDIAPESSASVEPAPIEPIVVEAPAESSWGPASKKKGKKDKKKRGSALTFDEAPEDVSPPTPDATVGDLTMEESRAPKADAAEDEWAVPVKGKKGKKDEKMRASGFTLDVSQEDASSLEPGSASQDTAESRLAADVAAPAEQSVGQSVDSSGIERPFPPEIEQPASTDTAVAEAESVVPPSGKKSKKEEHASTSTLEEPSEDFSTPEAEPGIKEPTPELHAALESVQVEESTVAEPIREPVIDGDEWAVPSTGKKSKKDKKKKKSTLDWDEPVEPVTAPEPADATRGVEPESTIRPEAEASSRDILPESATMSTEPASEVAVEAPLQPSTPAAAPAAEDESAFPVSSKKSKKGKKNRASTFAAEEPVTASGETSTTDLIEQSASIEAGPADNRPEDVPLADGSGGQLESGPVVGLKETEDVLGVAPAQQESSPAQGSSQIEFERAPDTIVNADNHEPEVEPDAWAFPTKKSKKYKKKKRKSIPGAFEDEDVSGTATPATPMEGEPIATDMGQAAPEVDRDLPVNDQMMQDVPPQEGSERVLNDAPMTDAPGHAPANAEAPLAVAGISEEETQDVPRAPEPAAGDEWSFTPKKSKKDKKKQRQSTLQDVESISASPMEVSRAATPAEPTREQPPVDALPQEIQLEQEQSRDLPLEDSKSDEPEPEVDWASDPWGMAAPKKSKKDKKKKKQSANEEDGDRATLEPGATEKPENVDERPSAQEKAAYLVAMAFGSKQGSRATSPARETMDDVVKGEPVARKDKTLERQETILAGPIESAEAMQDENPPVSETPPQPESAENDWGFLTKKSKKDKKKKMQSTFDDGPTEPTQQDRDEIKDEPPAKTSDIEPSMEPTTNPTTSLEGQATEEVLNPSASQGVDMNDAALTEEFSLAPTKKSKKDKKKRQPAFDESEHIISGTATPAEAVDILSLTEPISRPSVNEILSGPAGSQDTSASQLADLTSPIKVQDLEEDDIGQPQDQENVGVGLIEGSLAQEEPATRDMPIATGPASVAQLSEPSAQAFAGQDGPLSGDFEMAADHEPVQTQAVDDWYAPVPKSKKDKKKKRRESPMGDFEMTEDHKKTEPADPVVEGATASREPFAATADDTRQETAQAQAPEDFHAPVSASKKDKKKKKKRQSGMDDVEMAESSSATPRDSAADIAVGSATVVGAVAAAGALAGDVKDTESREMTKDAAVEEDDWPVSRKKSKKDKKKKQLMTKEEDHDVSKETDVSERAVDEPSQARHEDENVRPSEEVPRHELDWEMEQAQAVPRSPVLPLPDMREAEVVDPHEPEQSRSVPGVLDAEPQAEVKSPNMEAATRDPPQPAEDDWYSTPKKSKKGKKDKKGRKSTLDYYDESPVPAASTSRGKEMEYLEAPPEAPDPPPAFYEAPEPPPAVPEDVSMNSEAESNISDSTRDRRKRRRSPPAWTGEEPPDLPRDRALTPPREHNDIMDTALGVAAGLGFGASEGDRRPRPKSTDTSRERRREEAGWSFANARTSAPQLKEAVNRDSGIQFDSPTLGHLSSGHGRDSGYMPSPDVASSWERRPAQMEDDHGSSLRPARPQSPTSSTEDLGPTRRHVNTSPKHSGLYETPVKRAPSPIESTSKDRSSVVFKSSPARPTPERPHIDTSTPSLHAPVEIHRSPSIHGHHKSRSELRERSESPHQRRVPDSLTSNLIDRAEATPVNRAVFSPPPSSVNQPLSPPKSPLQPILEDGHSHTLAKGAALAAVGAGAVAMLSRDSGSGAKSLGRSKSRTSSLRNLRGSFTSPYEAEVEAGSSRTPVDGSHPSRDRDMADQYEGYGHYPGSPMSPTRPPSVTKRRSMQQITDLQSRVDQLANENRSLAEAKITAERHMEEFHLDRNRNEYATAEALRTNEAQLRERDEEIARLKEEVATLTATHETLRSEHEQRYSVLQDTHAQERSQWEGNSRELETLRGQHNELSTGMEDIVRHEIDTAVAEKNAEIERLYRDLELAKGKIRELQSRILASPADDIVVVRDEDYFDNACQQLCQHVQQWVLRFSKFSDTRVCRRTNEVREEKIVDRFENAILDGSDVDAYLADRVKRRDVLMSVVMTMIWEYVFTRYLFGMDRDQRQKLKQLEKTLGEVGPAKAVQQWRAMTLTLLAKRDAFRTQCEQDTQAVALEIFSTLSRFLPPPGNLEQQIQESLKGVMRAAVGLSVEMRCQRANFIMLPPLQPEYDTNGDLARKVYFNASLMNERSGETTSNEELEQQQAVVRMVLFPLVVKKGGDDGGDDQEEIVVCPAQVLVARERKGKGVRRSGSGKATNDGRNMAGRSQGAMSTHSLAMSGVDMDGGME